MVKPAYSLNIRGKLLSLERPLVMGILNITPDSFHEASRMQESQAILYKASKMLAEGADILDIGAQSTRPGAEIISEEEEKSRIRGVISGILQAHPDAIISIDTFRSGVAKAAVEEGACMVNDVSGGDMDPQMFPFIAEHGIPYIIMHHEGIPASSNPSDEADKTGEVIHYFSEKINRLWAMGVKDLILDPGFGFGKNTSQNLKLLRHLDRLEVFGLPILAGLSRKKTIQQILDTNAAGTLNGTTVMNTIALTKGASILRVHDVAEAKEAVRLYCAVEGMVSGKNS
ncbi:MAG: dihydropteroate synthase [Flavobacteriales bacterium]|nr:dihydropteroate synthase [Flavobacteriales bacterium]